MANISRDQNREVVLAGVEDNASSAIKDLLVDPSTGRLKVSAVVSTALNDLSDVDASSPSNNEVLTYNSSSGNWEAQAGGVSQLSDLSDVDVSSPSAGEVLIYHATNSQFENANVTAGDGLTRTTGDASLTLDVVGGTAITANANDIQVTSSGITNTELDESTSPTWTGTHDFTGANLDLPTATDPTPTTEGRITWDTDDDKIKVGNGSGTTTIGGGGASQLSDLSDANVSSPTAGQLLIYDATDSQFENANITAGTGISKTEADASLTLSADEANIDHDSLQNFVSNEHIDHSSVSISSGTGLSGGGDITASRTLSLNAATSDLTDAASPNATAAGQLLIWDDTDSQFENATLTGGNNISITNADASVTIASDISNLSDLGDANVSSPSAGQSLLYHATNSQFENATITAGSGLARTTGDASLTLDVDITNATDLGASVASSDEVLVSDADDSNNIKKTTAQDIADLGGGGGGTDMFSTSNWTITTDPIKGSNIQSNTTGGSVVQLAPGVLISTGSGTNDSFARFSYQQFLQDGNSNVWRKNLSFRFNLVRWNLSDDGTGYVLFSGQADDNDDITGQNGYIGFKMTSSGGTASLFAVSEDGTTEESTDVSTTLTDFDLEHHTFDAIYTQGTDVKFYIDGSLVATHSSNIPTNSISQTRGGIWAAISNSSSATGDGEIRYKFGIVQREL